MGQQSETESSDPGDQGCGSMKDELEIKAVALSEAVMLLVDTPTTVRAYELSISSALVLSDALRRSAGEARSMVSHHVTLDDLISVSSTRSPPA